MSAPRRAAAAPVAPARAKLALPRFSRPLAWSYLTATGAALVCLAVGPRRCGHR